MSTAWNDLAELETVKEQKESANNLVLFDSTNLSFRYLQRKNYDNYVDDYIRTVTSIANSYNASRVICLFDAGASAYRKSIFPEYKNNRKVERTPEEQERFTKFFNCLNDVIDALPFEYYKLKGLEADDMIAYFVQHLKHKYNHVWIISSDRDLYQLLDENVSQFSIFSRKEVTLETLQEKYSMSPKEYMFSRIIEGDKGDNIYGIEGIGPKRSQALVKEYETLENLVKAIPLKGRAKYIQNLNAGKETLLLNEQLINLLDYIDAAIDSCEKSEEIRERLEQALV